MFYTTLNAIRACKPCKDGWEKLLRHLGKTQADDEPVSFLTILESNGLFEAILCLQALPEDTPEVRLFAVRCVREVQHLLRDERSLHAMDVSEMYAVGEATKEELIAASARAYDADCDATCDDSDASCDDYAASAAAYAASAAASAAAYVTASAAARVAVYAAYVAADDAARAAQEADFRAIFCS